jgi:histidinol-phosphatase
VTDARDDLELALDLGDPDLRVDTKTDDTPVTDADRAVEEMIRAHLAAARPTHAVLGEEGGASGDAEWRWIIDPIDGTKNFARGVPVWATLLSLQRDGVETCAVISAPALGRRWWARQDGGAHCNGRALHVSAVTRLEDASLSVSDVRDFARLGWGDGFARLGDTCRRLRGFGDFWSHMLVAEGAIDCGIEATVKEWDISAVRLIVREAGGRFTDFAGIDHIGGGSVITSNGLVHDEVLACLGS